MKGPSLLSRIFLAHICAALAALAVLALTLDVWLDRWDAPAPQQMEARGLVAASGILMGIVILFGSAIIARRVGRTLEEISREAAKLGHGESAAVGLSSGTRETQQLSQAINSMARELAGVIDELRTETGLREQILASMREGVILSDASTGLVYANPAAAAMFGRQDMDQLPPQLDAPGEREFTVYHPVRRELRSTSVKLSDGRTLAVIQDETARKRVDSIRRDFVANASHELKTPVAGILVTAETVAQAIPQDPQHARKFAGNLIREASRLSRLVQDLLDLARLEQEREPPQEVLLRPIVRNQINGVADRVRDKGLKLSSELEDDCRVLGLPDDLALMVRNLLDNAVIYTLEGEIAVSLKKTEAGVELAVTDTGVGIPSADLERIFERFYRVDQARSRETGGTGLGLSIVRHVAESHGGVVSVTSELGQGSRFVVRLPKAPPRNSQAETAPPRGVKA